MARSSIAAGSTNRVKNGLTSAVEGISSAIGRQIAEDLQAAIVQNLTQGGGSTGLSSAGYGNPVRKGRGYAHVATKATLNSIKVTPVRQGYSRLWRVSIGGAGVALNYGVRPGAAVDPARIEQWLAAKGLRANKGVGGRTGLARKIAQRIQLRGLAPTYFYTDAENQIRQRVRRGYYKRKVVKR